MAATHFPAHHPSHLPTLTVVDPATGQARSLTPVEAALRVETFGPLVVATGTYRFESVVGEARCRVTFPERARVYRARVGGEEATLVAGEAHLPTAATVGFHGSDAFELSWSGLQAGVPVLLEVAWVQVATPDGFGWSTRLPEAERVAYLAHQAEEAAGNGTGWRTEGEWLMAEGAMRPFTLFWWPRRDECRTTLHLYACGDAGLAVLTPPRDVGPALPRDVRVILAVADDAMALAQRVAQAIRAGLGEQDRWRLATLDAWPSVEEPAAQERCVQTLVVTDAPTPQLADLLAAVPTARVIGLRKDMAEADLQLDPTASWSRNQAGLEAFLAPLEWVCARDLVLRAREGEVLAALGDMGAIGLTWRRVTGVDGPCEVVGSDGRVCAQASPVVVPHEEAWKAFEALVGCT